MGKLSEEQQRQLDELKALADSPDDDDDDDGTEIAIIRGPGVKSFLRAITGESKTSKPEPPEVKPDPKPKKSRFFE